MNDYVAPPKTATKLSIAVRTFERMAEEIEQMGARTPHELMRTVEVSFIRDCAEMAARSSLTRTESRWGLYHDRADIPERDDEQWRYHLNLRKGSDGEMEFLKRPVAPYFVPVPDLDHLPSDHAVQHVHQPDLVGGKAPATAGSRLRPTEPATPPSPRIAAVVVLDEPTLADLTEYLQDDDAGVRRAAVAVLVENLPDGYQADLVAALGDVDGAVRAESADALRELVEVLPDPAAVAPYLTSADPIVRAVTLYVLSSRRVGAAPDYRAAVTDSDHRVRIEAVRALVSVDDVDGWPRRRTTTTARCGSPRAMVWPRSAPVPTPCGSCWPTGTRWCVRPRSPRWPPWVAPSRTCRKCNARFGNQRGRSVRARCGHCRARPRRSPSNRCRRRCTTRTWMCARRRC